MKSNPPSESRSAAGFSELWALLTNGNRDRVARYAQQLLLTQQAVVSVAQTYTEYNTVPEAVAARRGLLRPGHDLFISDKTGYPRHIYRWHTAAEEATLPEELMVQADQAEDGSGFWLEEMPEDD